MLNIWFAYYQTVQTQFRLCLEQSGLGIHCLSWALPFQYPDSLWYIHIRQHMTDAFIYLKTRPRFLKRDQVASPCITAVDM